MWSAYKSYTVLFMLWVLPPHYAGGRAPCPGGRKACLASSFGQFHSSTGFLLLHIYIPYFIPSASVTARCHTRGGGSKTEPKRCFATRGAFNVAAHVYEGALKDVLAVPGKGFSAGTQASLLRAPGGTWGPRHVSGGDPQDGLKPHTRRGTADMPQLPGRVLSDQVRVLLSTGRYSG